ncbi:hypothetical protein [Paenibacillus sp. PAMC21692]|uniref:hypothetical protein n=1 Tax=Paenibacillus sp. PAMC21692 TaxID=2762320 RepID=UPI00164D3BA2|nr:hypothetical protein [Paenibacillus sp. PAMC21692]QNK58342.1 hypothetical protein H7F31_05250 [Paenibacillus sp. PAMC21692]
MKRIFSLQVIMLVMLTLFVSLINPSQMVTVNAQTGMTQYKGASLQTFMLNSKSYIQIKDVYFKYGSKDKEVYFTLTVYNGDNTSLDFLDYWVELSSAAGSKYPIKSYSGNSKSGQVAPKTSKDFIFYSQIDTKLFYSDLNFKLVKWDFSLPNYTKVIGQVKVPGNYQNAVPINYYYINTTDNNKTKSYLSPGTEFTLGANKQLNINLNLENNGMYDFSLPEYRFYIRTKAGLVLRLTHDPIENKELAPGDKLSYSLRTNVNSKTDVTGAQLLVTSLDGEAKIEIPKAIYNISWSKSNNLIVDEKKAASILVEDKAVSAQIDSIFTDSSGTSNNIIFTTKWINKGKEVVTLPDYKFEIMSKDGIRYPVEVADQTTGVQLIPGIEKEITIQAILPTAKTEGLTLLVKLPKSEVNKVEYVTTAFRLSKLQEVKGVLSKTYKNEQGIYQINISKAERLPWGNQDIINAFIEIKNIGTKSQAIPKLQTLLRMNSQLINNEKINFIQLNNSGLIEPNESIYFAISTKVPYTYKFSELSLNLTDEISESKKQTIGLFKLNEIKSIPELSISDAFEMESVGRRATINFESTYMFEGKDKDLIYAEFKYTNNESRFGNLPSLYGYFKTADGQYIEAKINNVKRGVAPGGKTLLAAYAEVPKTLVNNGNIQLIIGEGLNGQAFSTPETSPDSYISAKAFKLPKDQTKVSDNIADLKVSPYTFTMHKLNTMLNDVENIKLDMTYTLNKTGIYDHIEKETKLYFEVTDGRNAYGTTVTVEPAEGDGLQVGEEKQIIIPIKGLQLGNVIFNGYSVNVYEEIDGFKRLLSSKKFGTYQLIR